MRVKSTVAFPTIEQIKQALGIEASDQSKDQAITTMLASTISIIESYLRRGIAFAHEIEEFDPPETRADALLLYRFPVSEVQSVTQEGAPITGYRVHKRPGVVRWRDAWCTVRCGCEHMLSVVVEYDGGYPDDAWPADLLDAVMQTFYSRWNSTGGTGNLAKIDASESANRSVSVDGLTITREGVQSTYAFGGTVMPVNTLLAPVAALLDPYLARPLGGV